MKEKFLIEGMASLAIEDFKYPTVQDIEKHFKALVIGSGELSVDEISIDGDSWSCKVEVQGKIADSTVEKKTDIIGKKDGKCAAFEVINFEKLEADEPDSLPERSRMESSRSASIDTVIRQPSRDSTASTSSTLASRRDTSQRLNNLIKNDDRDGLEYFIGRNGIQIESFRFNTHNRSLLHAAVKHFAEKCARYLVGGGIDQSLRDLDFKLARDYLDGRPGWTFLAGEPQEPQQMNDGPMADYTEFDNILRRNGGNFQGELVEFLERTNRDLADTFSNGQNLIHRAVICDVNVVSVVMTLHANGCPINQQDNLGSLPIAYLDAVKSEADRGRVQRLLSQPHQNNRNGLKRPFRQ